jgi:hypothetical protein
MPDKRRLLFVERRSWWRELSGSVDYSYAERARMNATTGGVAKYPAENAAAL